MKYILDEEEYKQLEARGYEKGATQATRDTQLRYNSVLRAALNPIRSGALILPKEPKDDVEREFIDLVKKIIVVTRRDHGA